MFYEYPNSYDTKHNDEKNSVYVSSGGTFLLDYNYPGILVRH